MDGDISVVSELPGSADSLFRFVVCADIKGNSKCSEPMFQKQTKKSAPT